MWRKENQRFMWQLLFVLFWWSREKRVGDKHNYSVFMPRRTRRILPRFFIRCLVDYWNHERARSKRRVSTSVAQTKDSQPPYPKLRNKAATGELWANVGQNWRLRTPKTQIVSTAFYSCNLFFSFFRIDFSFFWAPSSVKPSSNDAWRIVFCSLFFRHFGQIP